MRLPHNLFHVQWVSDRMFLALNVGRTATVLVDVQPEPFMHAQPGDYFTVRREGVRAQSDAEMLVEVLQVGLEKNRNQPVVRIKKSVQFYDTANDLNSGTTCIEWKTTEPPKKDTHAPPPAFMSDADRQALVKALEVWRGQGGPDRVLANLERSMAEAITKEWGTKSGALRFADLFACAKALPAAPPDPTGERLEQAWDEVFREHHDRGIPQWRDPVVHNLKCETKFYIDIERGRKTFEIRKNDRDFRTGDYLRLLETNPAAELTGRSLYVVVPYLTTYDQRPGNVVMAIGLVTSRAVEGLPVRLADGTLVKADGIIVKKDFT